MHILFVPWILWVWEFPYPLILQGSFASHVLTHESPNTEKEACHLRAVFFLRVGRKIDVFFFSFAWMNILNISISNVLMESYTIVSCSFLLRFPRISNPDLWESRFKVGTKRLLPRPLCACSEMWATSCVIFGVSWKQKTGSFFEVSWEVAMRSEANYSPGQFEWHKITNRNWMTVGNIRLYWRS